MSNTNKILSLLLALILIGSNLAFSGHISSHTTTDTSSCYLCIHPGGSDSAIAIETDLLIVIPVAVNLIQSDSSSPFLPVFLHDHQSRAPPPLS